MVCAANFLQYQVNECLPLLYPTVCQLSKTYFLPSGGKSQNHACVSSDNQFVCPQLDLSKDSKTRSDQRKRFIEAKKRSHYSTGSSTGYGYSSDFSTGYSTDFSTDFSTDNPTKYNTSSEAFCDEKKCPLQGNFSALKLPSQPTGMILF